MGQSLILRTRKKRTFLPKKRRLWFWTLSPTHKILYLLLKYLYLFTFKPFLITFFFILLHKKFGNLKILMRNNKQSGQMQENYSRFFAFFTANLYSN